MGTFTVTIDVGSPDRNTWRQADVLVDTGATSTWLPRDLLVELGHVPTTRKSFQLGDGRLIDSDIADVPVRIGGEVHSTICAYAEAGAEPVMGAVTLEEFLLAPDPINKRLVPVVGLAMNLGRER
jgi:predicted aspartyl protease